MDLALWRLGARLPSAHAALATPGLLRLAWRWARTRGGHSRRGLGGAARARGSVADETAYRQELIARLGKPD